jgi:protein-S-isoprenylcysteine O-methyltransferase Ste14
MDSKQQRTNDVSITRIAVLYVVCLIVGGLSVLNAFLHPNSAATILGCSVAAIAAIAGFIYCTRAVVRTLNV